MEFTTLGRTGLSVSVAGLGCGGHSRLGQAYGSSVADGVAVVAAALDAGVNFIDTAAAYRTEPIVAAAIAGKRDGVFLSSKTAVHKRAADTGPPRFISATELAERLEGSLARLGTDYIDIYNLHGVLDSELDYVQAELLPALLQLKAQGKIRFLGITERFAADTAHAMLQRAVASNAWDVVMVGFNLLNPSARHSVLTRTRELDVGVQDMFAVRRAISNPTALGEDIQRAVSAGQIDPTLIDLADPLGQILKESGANSLVEMAYRFCRHEPGIHVVLTGTGNIDHLAANIVSINAPPLPDHTQRQLVEIFGNVNCISGN
jgi:aryl-alcohol dehydrogenase-like predicted oxidoreductase